MRNEYDTGAPNSYVPKESPMSDAVKRAFRSFVQGAIGILALLALPVLNGIVQAVIGGGAVELDLNLWRSIFIATFAGGLIGLISFAQNLFEQKAHTTVLPK